MSGPAPGVVTVASACCYSLGWPRRPASKCPCCGRRGRRLTREPGRALPYRNIGLTLPTELPVLTCRLCRHLSTEPSGLEEMRRYWALLVKPLPSPHSRMRAS